MALLTEVWPDNSPTQEAFHPILPTSEPTKIESNNNQKPKSKKKKIIEYFSEKEESSTEEDNDQESEPEITYVKKKQRKKSLKKNTNRYLPSNSAEIEHFAFQPRTKDNQIPMHVRRRNIQDFNIGADLDLDFPKSRILLLGCGVFLLYAFAALRNRN